MKEAAGEANLTVITIILIGIVVAVAIPLINNVMNTSADRTRCIELGGDFANGTCTDPITGGNINLTPES